jgi:O-antigen/teichoic acid export membrane protein
MAATATYRIHQSLITAIKSLSNPIFNREFLLFGFATFFFQSTRFGVSLLAANMVGPLAWGTWQLLYLILAYSSILHLGITNGMLREIPILTGEGDNQRAQTVASVTIGIVIIVCLTCSSFLFLGSFLDSLPISASYIRGIALILPIYLLHNYFEVYLRSSDLFVVLSKQRIFFSIIFIASVIPSVFYLRLEGYLYSQAFTYLLTVIFILALLTLRINPIYSTSEAFRLIKIGLPIMMGQILFTFMSTVDRWIIATYLNLEQLGYYSLAIMVLSGLMMFPIMMAQRLYPKMAQAWGQTSKVFELKYWLRLNRIMCLTLLTPLTVLVGFLLPKFVTIKMPAYEPGITAMLITLAVPVFFGLTTGYNCLLNLVGKQFSLTVIRGVALVVNILLNFVFVQMGMGIEGVALGTALSFMFYFFAAATMARIFMRQIQRNTNMLQTSSNTI